MSDKIFPTEISAKPVPTVSDEILIADASDALNAKVSTIAQLGAVIPVVAGNVSGLSAVATSGSASDLASGTLPDARLSSSVTKQGNSFNGASQLVQLDGSGKLPAVDGSQLTNLLSSGHTIQDEGSSFAQRLKLNFIGSGVSVSDNPGTGATDVTIPGGGVSTGDVIGPSSAVDSNFASFDTTTGKKIKDSGSKASDFATSAQGAKADTAIQVSNLSAGIASSAGKVNVTSAATGIIYGCKLTVNSTTSVDISPGYLQVIDRSVTPLAPTVTYVAFPGVTGLTDAYRTTDSATTFKIDASGSVIQQNSSPSEQDFISYAVVGKSIHTNRVAITAVSQFQEMSAGSDQRSACFARFIGVLAKDSLISANGANLYINRGSGFMHRIGSNYANSYTMPDMSTISSGSQIPVFYRYRDGSGGFKVDASVATINPNVYDNGSGTLVSPGGNKYTNQFVYVFTNGNTFVVPGQVVYNTLSLATAAAATENPIVDPQFADANLRTVISLRSSTTSLTNTAMALFTQGGLFGIGNGFSGGGSVTIPGDGTYSFQYNDNGVFNGVQITGLVKGNGAASAPSAAVANVDYLPVASPSATGIMTLNGDNVTTDPNAIAYAIIFG